MWLEMCNPGLELRSAERVPLDAKKRLPNDSRFRAKMCSSIEHLWKTT